MLGQSLIIPICTRPPLRYPLTSAPHMSPSRADVVRQLAEPSCSVVGRLRNVVPQKPIAREYRAKATKPSVILRKGAAPHGGEGAESIWAKHDVVDGRRRAPFAYPARVTSWMRRRDHNVFANASSLLVCGLLAGLVVA